MTAVMLGRYPSRLRWDLSAIPLRLLSRRTALAETLRRSGYVTYAFVNDWIHRNMRHIQPGFARFEQAPHPRGSSAVLVQRAIAALQRHTDAAPFFLWIHLNDPHAPYIDGYDREVQRVDEQAGQLLGALRRRADGARTAVVFTGDHAEALSEHQTITHSHTVYNSEVHIPLIIHVPNLKGGRRRQHVTLVDLTSTILDLLGVESALEYDGRSLLPLMLDAGRAEPRPVFAVNCFPTTPLRRWVAVYWERWKLVRRVHDGRDELFDLDADPGETHDLSRSGAEIMEALRLEASLFWRSGDFGGGSR
jgi:arylsulfatase A-like enzyme